jgi:hypothetical protein
LWRHEPVYLADRRCVYQARDTALVLGDGVINVARRGRDGSWKYAISVLHGPPAPLDTQGGKENK